MGTMLISGRGAPCPAPAQCLEIDLSVEAEQARAQTRHMAWAQAEPLVQWAEWGQPPQTGKQGSPRSSLCPWHTGHSLDVFGRNEWWPNKVPWRSGHYLLSFTSPCPPACPQSPAYICKQSPLEKHHHTQDKGYQAKQENTTKQMKN